MLAVVLDERKPLRLAFRTAFALVMLKSIHGAMDGSISGSYSPSALASTALVQSGVPMKIPNFDFESFDFWAFCGGATALRVRVPPAPDDNLWFDSEAFSRRACDSQYAVFLHTFYCCR
jgi:hypothetical protein